jgi:ribosome biogenesis protein BMS1
MTAEAQTNRSHRPARAKKNPRGKGNDPRAFASQSKGGKAQKLERRSQDILQKKLHAPVVDRSPVEQPPMVIAVAGPPKSGKTSLIKSLVKRYTRHNLAEVKGPITVVSGKKQRITFIECANDLNAMIDVSKVADLVLLMIDANFGFEMVRLKLPVANEGRRRLSF